jgi:hypothetical protein
LAATRATAVRIAVMLSARPALEQLAGFTVQPTRHHRSCVHIQATTRTLNIHSGLPHLVALPAGTNLLTAAEVTR